MPPGKPSAKTAPATNAAEAVTIPDVGRVSSAPQPESRTLLDEFAMVIVIGLLASGVTPSRASQMAYTTAVDMLKEKKNAERELASASSA